MLEQTAALLLAAWFAGLAGGSGHCLGMCGGIVGMLGVRQNAGLRGFSILFAAHTGRVLGYALAGGIAGFAGATVFGAVFGPQGLALLRGAAAVLVILIGLQLLLGRPLLIGLEKTGARVWRRIAPVFRGLLPPRNPLRALLVGALWGWLPCGLVYAQLTVATASGGALAGALVMASFGLGTVVSLSVVGALLLALGLGRLPRQASGALMLAFGVWTMLPLILPAHESTEVTVVEAPHAAEGCAHHCVK
jgi:hypothetical protein